MPRRCGAGAFSLRVVHVTPEEKSQLVAINACLALGRDNGPTEKLIEAANLMAAFPGFPEFLASNREKVPAQPWRRRELQAVHFLFLMSLLYRRDYEGAATLLWGEDTFTCEPHFVKLIWEAITKKRLINVLGCASASKTYSPAARFLLEWVMDPEFTLVRVMSTKEDHVRKNLFADMQRLYSGSVIQLPGKAEADAIATESGKRGGQGIFMIVIPRGPDAGGTIKGSKVKPRPAHPLFGTSSRTFLLIDEAQEVPENAFSEIGNLFSSMEEDDVEHTKIVMAANPKEVLSEYGKRCEPTAEIGGWPAVQTRDSNIETWESRLGWFCVRLNAMKCENVSQKKTVFPRFITANGVSMKIRDAGGDPDHPLIWSECWGMFPPSGSMAAVIQKHWVDRARKEWIFESVTQTVAAEDVALSGDLPTLSCGRIGRAVAYRDYEGNRHELTEPKWALQADVVGVLPRTNDSQLLADETMERLQSLAVKPKLFAIDRTGVGQGTHDIIRHQWREKVDGMKDGVVVDILGIHYSEKPTEVPICAEDTKTPRELYDSVIAEMWYATAKFLEYDFLAIGKNVDDFTIYELVNRLGGSPAGKGKLKTVESKDLFKLRNGGKSCDRADAFVEMVHCARLGVAELRPKAPDTVITPPARERPPLQGGLVFAEPKGFGDGFGACSFELTNDRD